MPKNANRTIEITIFRHHEDSLNWYRHPGHAGVFCHSGLSRYVTIPKGQTEAILVIAKERVTNEAYKVRSGNAGVFIECTDRGPEFNYRWYEGTYSSFYLAIREAVERFYQDAPWKWTDVYAWLEFPCK